MDNKGFYRRGTYGDNKYRDITYQRNIPHERFNQFAPQYFAQRDPQYMDYDSLKASSVSRSARFDPHHEDLMEYMTEEPMRHNTQLYISENYQERNFSERSLHDENIENSKENDILDELIPEISSKYERSRQRSASIDRNQRENSGYRAISEPNRHPQRQNYAKNNDLSSPPASQLLYRPPIELSQSFPISKPSSNKLAALLVEKEEHFMEIENLDVLLQSYMKMRNFDYNFTCQKVGDDYQATIDVLEENIFQQTSKSETKARLRVMIAVLHHYNSYFMILWLIKHKSNLIAKYFK